MEIIANVASRGFYLPDFEALGKKLIQNEEAIDRAIHFTGSFISLKNLLGEKSAWKMADWTNHIASVYPPKRTSQWCHSETRVETGGDNDDSASADLKHSAFRALSFIEPSLWDEAVWVGVAYTFGPTEQSPTFALVFENERAARRIFEGWKRDIGDEDTDEALQIVIVRGVSRAIPHAYRVLITSDPRAYLKRGNIKRFSIMSRVRLMEPNNSINLEGFLGMFRKREKYDLCCSIVDKDRRSAVQVNSLSIRKRKVLVKNAYEIGANDLEAMAIFPEDDPIIPDDVQAPPVLEVLERVRNCIRSDE